MADRLIAFDFDSTLVPVEVIDELAREGGVYDEVAAATQEAMEGGLDFSEAMRRRLAILAGLEHAAVERLAERIELRPGARTMLSTLRERGYRIAIISGGFLDVIGALLRRSGCEVDFIFANELRFEQGRLLDECELRVSSNKAEILRDLQQQLSIPRERTVAVGDGATDVPMFHEALVSVAIDAKPAAREAATVQLDGLDLTRILEHVP